MVVLRALGLDCCAYLGNTFVLPQCDADLAVLVPMVLALPLCLVVVMVVPLLPPPVVMVLQPLQQLLRLLLLLVRL